MYYIYNIISGELVSTAIGRMSLLRAWAKYVLKATCWNCHGSLNNINYAFDELSMTDYDTRVIRLPLFGTEFYREIKTLRTDRVYDSDDRIIDIRLWDECNEVLFPKRSRVYYCHNFGSKRHHHRVSGPSFLHRDLRNRGKEEGLSYKPSKVSAADAWDICERRYFAVYSSSKSWKDQTKAKKQWCKHKSKYEYESIKELNRIYLANKEVDAA